MLKADASHHGYHDMAAMNGAPLCGRPNPCTHSTHPLQAVYLRAAVVASTNMYVALDLKEQLQQLDIEVGSIGWRYSGAVL